MSEVQNISNLIQAGLSREEFIAKYKEMSEEIKNEPASSIFLGSVDDVTISRLFDSVIIAHDDGEGCDDARISQADVEKIAAYDGDSSSISDEDLSKYYEDLLKNTPVVSGTTDSDTPSMTYAQGSDMLHGLKSIKRQSAFNQKSQLQSEIDELIMNDTSISSEIKDKYSDMQSNLKKLKALREERKRHIDEAKRNIQIIETRKANLKSKADNTDDEEQKKNLNDDIANLDIDISNWKTDITNLNKDINNFNTDISRLEKEMDKLLKLIDQSNSETAQKVREKQSEMSVIDSQLEQDLSDIDTQIAQYQQQLILEAEQAGADSAKYANAGNDGHIGKTAAQALSNATGEIGVRELTGHNDGAAIAKYRNGVDNNAAWCASFVSWCYKGNDIFGYQASVSGIQMAAQRQGLYSEKGTYTPKAGDVMIQKNGCSHTGIVESVDPDGTIHTIEGNASNQVKRVTYRPGSKGYNHISGFVRMSERESA